MQACSEAWMPIAEIIKWLDTDQFPVNLNELVESILIILEAGGFAGGGINFDAKTRRNSTDLEDIFLAHIGGMDAFCKVSDHRR